MIMLKGGKKSRHPILKFKPRVIIYKKTNNKRGYIDVQPFNFNDLPLASIKDLNVMFFTVL